MSDSNILPRDQNHVVAAGFESTTNPGVLLPGQIIEATGRIKVDLAGGGGGDVVGPGSSTDDAVVRWNGTSGTDVNNSIVGLSDTGVLYPFTNDAGALGDATHSWADLFLASGAVINFANGNAVITHSSGILTVSTGDLRVTTAGTNAASVVTVGGTQTLTNKTLTSPVINVGSDATGDIYYRSAGGLFTRLPIGSSSNVLSVSVGGIPEWAAAPAASLVVGSTTITSGTTTRILYDNAGVLGEYTITGSGTVVAMQTSPTFVTDITTPIAKLSGTSNQLVFQSGGVTGTFTWTPTSTNKTATVPDRSFTLDNITTATTTSGTGFLKGNGTVISFDNTTYLSTITIGSTTITSGTTTRILYDNAGVVGEYTITGSGTVVAMQTSPRFITDIAPTTNDNAALGTASLSWSDLFLASGAVINFANGNVVMTHSSGILTMGTGELRITTPGTNSASVPTLGSTSTFTNKTLSHTVEPGTDDTYTGENMTGLNAGDTIAQWDAVYLDATSGRWEFTDADAAATAGGVLVGLAAEAGTDGNPLTVVLRGVIRNDGWNWTTVGAPLYLSTTPGAITQTAPSGTDDVIRIIGYVLSDDCIYLNPSNDWITHT